MKINYRVVLFSLLCPLFIITIKLPVHAALFGFENISANNAGDAAIGETQLFVDVTDNGGGEVLFTFSNTGLAASSITQIYFDDGSLSGIAGLIDADDGVGGDPGVDFSPGASPPNLPSANSASPPFIATSAFSAASDPPTQPNGVNPGESLGIVFNLQGGGTFADVLSELGTGDLRVGIHVQGFASGGSESFVNIVPIPTSALIFGTGLIGLIGIRRKIQKTG